MMFVCGFLGCLGQAFKRSPSATSLGAGECPNQQQRERHHNGDRNGRNGRAISHNGMVVISPHAGASDYPSGPAAVIERRSTQAGPHATSTQTAQMSRFEGDLQSGAVASAAAIAAATQPAALVKLDRGAPSRRTPLHVAAERGQLHVLSAIIENLCCAATAALLAENSNATARSSRGGTGDGAQPSASPAYSGDSDRTGGGYTSVIEVEVAEEGTSGRQLQQQHHHHHEQQQQQQQRHRGAGSHRTGQPHQRNSTGIVEEFPIARPGAGGVPLAPEQYIQFHLNMQDGEGTTALSLACRYGHVDCCRLLLANGSARTLSDARGNTPLHYAALRGHLGVLFMLLDEFVEPGQEEEFNGYVDARNHAGCTPLHYAVWGRQSGSVQVLLQHGADVMPRNSRYAQELTPPVMVVGSTPLHLAAARGHVEICRIILKTFAERVLEPLQLSEDDPQPPGLASLDPRVQVNGNGHMPYQVAQRLGFYPLAMLLRPSIPILRLFSDEERAVRFYGPAPLRAIAAEALNKKLLAELDALPTGLASAGPSATDTRAYTVEGQTRQLTPAPAESTGVGTAARGNVSPVADGMPGARRPVSAPATLEQLAAAAAMEAGEEPRGDGVAAVDSVVAHAQHPNPREAEDFRNPLAATDSGSLRTSAAASGIIGSGAVPGSSPAGTGRRGIAPRQLMVEIAVAGGTLDNDGRPLPSARRPVLSELSPGVSLPSPGSGYAHPTPPRTPPVTIPTGTSVMSPSGISPRLISPRALISSPSSTSPSADGGFAAGGSSSAAAPPASSPTPLQLSSRGSSGRRSTPPLASNRSSNAMLPAAAPLVAALSRPPSAPRANGQTTPPASGQILLSLPGQPDIPDMQALRMVSAREQTSSEPPPLTASMSAGEAAGSASRPTDEETAANSADDGGAVVVYGPRTPARRPSSGALHSRRLPESPAGTGLVLAPVSIATDDVARNGDRNSDDSSSTGRPATFSLFTLASLGTGASSTRRSNDGGDSLGLIRMRSNPLFEDVHTNSDNGSNSNNNSNNNENINNNVDGTVAASFVSFTSGTITSAAAAASNMPTWAEGASEEEEVAASVGQSDMTCAAVTPFALRLNSVHGADADEDHIRSEGRNGAAASRTLPPEAATAGAATIPTSGRETTAAAAVAAALIATNDEDLECGVCMEPLPMVAISPCRHHICGPCARRICCLNIQKPSHCPFCRATISAFVAPGPLTPTVA